jgi:hypothetical protein
MATTGVPHTVTCAKNGRVLYVNADGALYFRNGISFATPNGNAWT